MAQSTIALIVMGIALVLFTMPKIPLSVTTVLAMLCMAFFGIIDYGTAFSGFSNSATLLVAGMLIIGRACFVTGLAEKFGKLLCRFVGTNERNFVLMLFVVAGALGVFLNGALVVPLLMTIVDGIVSQSNGKITRKNTYFPIGMAATLGNNMTTISSASTIVALGIYYAAGYDTVPHFAPMLVNLPPFIIILIYYYFFGYRYQVKRFDFDDIPVDESASAGQGGQEDKPVWKMVMTGLTLVGVTIALIAGNNFGACALVGSAILILTGCLNEKDAYRNVSWSTVIVVAASIGFSAGFNASGAGIVAANFIIRIFGTICKTPFAMCVLMFFIGNLISNVMSDNAAAAMLVPIAIALAKEMGADPLPFALATAYGVKDAIGTPLSVATMTMLQPAGYRFKDYVTVAGVVDLLMVILGCVMLKIVYFL